MLTKPQFIRNVFITLVTVLTMTGIFHTYKNSKPKVVQGSFHIAQYLNDQWEQKHDANYSVEYQTKDFQLIPQNNQIKIRINQNTVSYGDIEFVQLRACGTIVTPEYARYVDTEESVLDDILLDDHNVVVNHEKPIELLWKIPEECEQVATLSLKANEYESPEKNAFRFPDWAIPLQSYTFQNNGSLTIDGLLTEIDGLVDPQYSPFWTAGTGHPSNNTHIYIKDDADYVYFAVDITLDNTNEFGPDWLKIIAQNTTTGEPVEYRVDDYHDEYGKCSFGLTSKVPYKHQTCEIRIPKKVLTENKLDFILRYYGTGGAPAVSIDTMSFSATTSDSTPTISGRALAEDGASALTGVSFGLADSQVASEGNIVLNYNGSCIADDGAFDETIDTFTCTTSTLSPGGYRMFIRATNGSESGTNNTAIFTVTDGTAPSLTLTAVTDPTTDTTPTLSGTSTDVSGTVSSVEFQMDGTGGSWSACIADDGTFDEASETFTCTPSTLSVGSHTIYVRTTDNSSNVSSNSTDEFTIAAAPTSTPTQGPSATPAPNNNNNETVQIPQGSGGSNSGGVMSSVKDSNTFGQRTFSVIEPNTLTFNAFLSARAIAASFPNNILPNPMTNGLSKSTVKTNAVYAGGTHIGVKTTGGIYWQVGNVQNIWYKAYAPVGSTIEPAKIIPELQKKPSIITLGYMEPNLIPPGKPLTKFNAKKLKLAHSLDGIIWKILPTSVVDTTNRTVSALHRIGGYYMISGN
ncbi:MAG: hypothetical protein WBO77_02940 [Microgenomates group bacterium]